MNQDHPNADLVIRAFEAIQRGDVESFWATQSDDARASIFGEGDLAGTFTVPEVRDWIPCQVYGKLSSMTVEPPPYKRMEVVDVLAGDNHAVLIYEVTGRDPERRMRGAAICRIDDGKITNIQHFDPLAAAGGLKALR
jgi:ketosteroid isomerase-like protein